MALITWLGHSCFKIESKGYAVLLDPYSDGAVPGLKELREEADLVLCSHEHGDHNARELIRITEKEPAAVNPFTITTLESFHDHHEGAHRGKNTIHILDDGNCRIAHMGDQGCIPEQEQLEQLQSVDVLLIPVGGHYTIDGAEAAELTRKIAPGAVVPMHYRDPERGFGYDVISTPEAFTEEMGYSISLDTSILEAGKTDPSFTEVLLLKPQMLKKQ